MPPRSLSAYVEIASGADQSGVRLYNERLLLSLVRRFGPLSKIEVARLTGLSVQSTSAIMNRLQADGLLKREAPLRGRVGQPTIPMSLDPDGAYSLGLKIGRRSCDLVLVDFRGAVRKRAHQTFAFPTPARSRFRRELARPCRLADRAAAAADRRARRRRAVPVVDLGDRNRRAGRRNGRLARLRHGRRDREGLPWPVTLCNDATAACAAEFFFGSGWRYRDFLYFFVGAFIGGGLVLDGALRIGPHRQRRRDRLDAGRAKERRGVAPQLIACASIYQLERRLAAAGADASSIWATPQAWADFGAALDDWIEDAAEALAYASVAAISVIDFEAIVVDGEMPATIRDRLVARTAQVFESLDRRGIERRGVHAGHDRRRCGRDRRSGPAVGESVRTRPRGVCSRTLWPRRVDLSPERISRMKRTAALRCKLQAALRRSTESSTD